MLAASRFRRITEERRPEFIQRGVPDRYFFTHRAYYVPKCGPDALRLARDMCGRKTLDGHIELLVYADPTQLEEFPRGLFFDDDIIWHRQQFGRTGHIAFAYLFQEQGNLYCLNCVSDLVQRISRRREYKTRVETRFRGWHRMLFNSILNFAAENGLNKIYSPTSALVMAHSDKARRVQKELFERVYDRGVNHHFSATRENDWWVIDVAANRDRLVVPETREEELPSERTICICHDIERGFGHTGIDVERENIATRIAPKALAAMIRCEEEAGTRATYNVLGCFFNEVRSDIEAAGHCLGFHSYNHVIRKYWGVTQYYWRARRLLASFLGGAGSEYADQLFRCRLVDMRVRGFRMPQSRVTAEWDAPNLIYRNFDWCGTSLRHVGGSAPALKHGLVKIPIEIDDFPMYKTGMPFSEWEERLVRLIGNNDFVAFGLHDCYADLWLPGYTHLLDRILQLGKIKTLDVVADEILFAHAM